MADWEVHHKKNITFCVASIVLSMGIGLIAYRYGIDITSMSAIDTLKNTEPLCFTSDDTERCLPELKNAACAFFCNLHKDLLTPYAYCNHLLIAGTSLIVGSLLGSTVLFYRFSEQEKATQKNRDPNSMSIQMSGPSLPPTYYEELSE